MEVKRRNILSCRALDDFPPDVLADILRRLPVESILTSRAVCTTFGTVTRHPNFIKLHGASQKKKTRVILKEAGTATASHLLLLDIEERTIKRIPLKRNLANLQVKSSCKGLICMTHPMRLGPVAIYNPITGEHEFLPISRSERRQCNHQHVALGFDDLSNNYKVARSYSIYSRRGIINNFEIICLGNQSWRKLHVPKALLHAMVHDIIFWDGDLYFEMTMENQPIVVKFSLQLEQYDGIPFIGSMGTGGSLLGLIESGGSLYCFKQYGLFLTRWRLTEDEGGSMSFVLSLLYATSLKWNRDFTKFLCEMDQESILAQVGYYGIDGQHWDMLRQVSVEGFVNLDLQIPGGLPYRFEAFSFEPSLLPLQAENVLI